MAGSGGAVGGAGGGRRLMPMVFALAFGAAAAGGTYYLVSIGVLPAPGDQAAAGAAREDPAASWESPTFVMLDPILASLGPEARARHLRATLALEVDPGSEDAVREALPRIVDILNVYLRTVDERDFEMPSMMMSIRAQMLQQVRMVAPPQSVRAVLLQEFILN